MNRCCFVFFLALLGIGSLSAEGASQSFQVATSRGPRFVAAGARRELTPDASEFAVLRRRVTLALNSVPLDQALKAIVKQAALEITYSPAIAPTNQLVSLHAQDITVAAALTEILLDLNVDVSVARNGHLALVRRSAEALRTLASGVTGQVTDAKTKLAVARVEVLLAGTRWQTVTDTSGHYRLADVDTGTYTLTLRRLGYRKMSERVVVRADREDTVNVALTPMATRLDELVTTATGQRRRMDIANDVTTINADSVMQAAPIRSLTDLLEARVPGLTVQRTSGAPGDPARLRLRGAASPLRSNDPIVVVDGMRFYAEQSAARSANLARRTSDSTVPGYTSATPSPLDYIDPNTIEKIEVLKGPSAATLYGQDAANGVIVITTKRGKAGPTRWTARAAQGRTTIEGDYPTLFFRWGHDRFTSSPSNCPVSNSTRTNGVRVPCLGDSVQTFQLLNDPTLTVLDQGRRTEASLGVSGGTQALTYTVTGSYQNELGLVELPGYEADRYRTLLGGVAPPDWMQRPQHLTQWGVMSTIVARLGANADVALRAGLSRTDQQKSSLQDQLGQLMSTYLDRASGQYYVSGPGYVNATPNALSDYFERATDGAMMFSNGLTLNYRPHTWLAVSADAGLQGVHRADGVFFPRGPVNDQHGSIDTTGYVSAGQGTSIVSTVNLRANVFRPLGRGFQFQFAAGANYYGTSIKDVAEGTHNLAPGSSLQGTVTDFVRSAEASDATFGWYVEPSVGNSKINFTSGLRLDGGSSYGANVSGFRLPTFPKLGFSYLVSDESWFPLKTLFQSFRVRVSYGRASRQPGPKDRLRLYNIPRADFADSQSVTDITLQTLGNTEVRPERTAEFEGGFDADLLDNRLTLGVSGYRKTTDDALLGIPVAPEIYGEGVSIIKNIGVTRNTGVSLDLGAHLVRSGPVTWATQLLVSKNRNFVVALGPRVTPFYTSGNAIDGGTRIAAGYPLFGRWSRPILGYADDNGNGVLEPSEIQLGDTAVYVGATAPNYTASLFTTVSLWRGAVTVNAGFAYEDGLSQRNEVARDLAFFSQGAQVPGTSLASQASTIVLDKGFSVSDYNWIQTVNTLRFNSLSVRYAVPPGLAGRLGAQNLSVALLGGNLGLWTNYRGLDPNVNAFGTGNNVTDTGVLPQSRTWQLQIDATY